MVEPEGAGVAVQDEKKKARFLRVKVVDAAKDTRPVVNITVPIGVANWGMKMAKAFSPQLKDVVLDWDSLMAIVDEGEQGKIVDVVDEAEHKTVEVWID